MHLILSSILLAANAAGADAGSSGAAGDAARGLFWDHQAWHDMFSVALPIFEKMARPIIVYLFLVIALRIFGKRELTNINPFDFVVLLTLSNTVQNAIIGDDNSISGGIVGAITLMAVNYTVVRFVFKHRRLDQLLEGSPTKLIDQGKVCKDGLAKELLTEAELLTIAHRQGFEALSEVETCVLEPGGNFFVKGRTPSSEDQRHAELVARHDALIEQNHALLERIDTLMEKVSRLATPEP